LVGDLILSIFLEKAYIDAIQNGVINDPEIDINKHIKEKKHDIGLKILQLFVDFDEMKRIEGLDMIWM
jgi:hypothetical protein